ncbi:conserved unknown protein [Ectocarpus siliculosus]|uniref:riboflavin kinase n=1 Tax=Ectocarpus siliculosus TaxID=2880 RepID=D8LND2_ECTSI|nr:conserved unknown protein [Ectocarpus siliculosus]|eukprot:CBN77289.1 conserved unknown protein [Ectocarpus siliculosus]
MEPHLLHEFDQDFYGEKLHVLLCGFIRKELNFNSLGATSKQGSGSHHSVGEELL